MTAEEAARRIFGERAAFYTTSAAHTDQQSLARLVELAAPQPGWTALDIATGTGHTGFALAPQVAAVVGIDLTPEMLAEARGLQARNGLTNVRFEIADAHRLPFPDASFEIVACRRAAHHFSNLRLALAEMVRVLRPGGRLVIDDRSVPEDDFVDRCMNLIDWYHDESHVRQYRPSEWDALLTRAGLTVTAIEPYRRQRPLTSLTHNATPENVTKIHHLIEGFSEPQRAAMGIETVDGELSIYHWYLLAAATKPATTG